MGRGEGVAVVECLAMNGPDGAGVKDDELLAVNEALDRFATLDKERSELVKLRYFVGLTLEEAAEVLGISHTMAKRHWTYARAWLQREIKRSQAS